MKSKQSIKIFALITFILCFSYFSINFFNKTIEATSNGVEEVKILLNEFFKQRGKALLNQDLKEIEDFYDKSSTYGKWALDHERRRIEYVKGWSEKRNLKFTEAESFYRIKSVKAGENSIWVYAIETMKMGYVYDKKSDIINLMGLGIRHSIQLVKLDGKWLIRRDWYYDPLDEDSAYIDASPAEGIIPDATPTSIPQKDEEQKANKKGKYDREKAVAYADKYAGAAWGSGNNYEYNPKYKDYYGVGGDCTNYVSQVLHEGGGLPMDNVWFFNGKDASTAWAQAPALFNYLIYTGRGKLIAKGHYLDMIKPTEQYPQGAIKALEKGDLICYEEKGEIVHFAVVTGFDSMGIPVVNTHTSDRYHVPFDLGWDKRVIYRFIHIND
ncbi:amidase domain-containing protein [Caldanaerobacter sp.]|uniref:amidase domain-containing protein n=1 Tax=Caldanaerobacter sp. TaxID=2930036 RepID=UPI003C70D1F6